MRKAGSSSVRSARTGTVRGQCPPARPGIPVPGYRDDLMPSPSGLIWGFLRREGGFGQRARGGMGPPAAPELFGVGQRASDRDRGQQSCAGAGRQRVASLEVQAEPGPAAPGQCGITPASRRRRTACSVPASRRASRGPRGSPAVIWRTRQSVLSMFIGMSLALTQSLTAEPQARGKRSQHGLARHDGRPDAQTVRQFR